MSLHIIYHGEFVMVKISWGVRNGEDVLFWLESRNGHILLARNAAFLDIHDRLSTIWVFAFG